MRTQYFINNRGYRGFIALRKFKNNQSFYFTQRENVWKPSIVSLKEIKTLSCWLNINRDDARRRYPKAFKLNKQ